jgi:hypothetical protein
MGASFVGRGVIDNLQGRVDSVQARANRVEDANGQLQGQVDRLNEYVKETQAYAVARSLTGVRINLVVERGTDGGIVDDQATLIRQAGGTLPGIVWLEDSWSLDTAESADALRTATGLTNRTRPALRAAAARLLGQRLATSAPAAPATDDLLTKLADAKFISLAGAAGSSTPTAGDFAGTPVRVAEIGGPGHKVPADTIPAIAGGVLDGGAADLIGEAFVTAADGPDRAGWIDPMATSDALRGRISTVDNVDMVEGRVGATLALSELGLGLTGNYGITRSRQVPEKISTTPVAK